MSKQVTITLPDELREKVKQYKQRINISETCQKALEQKISDFEKRKADLENDPNLDAILERLRAEKAEEDNFWRERGRRAGMLFAKCWPYGELKMLATKYKTSNEVLKGEKPDLTERECENSLHHGFFDNLEDFCADFGDNDEILPPMPTEDEQPSDLPLTFQLTMKKYWGYNIDRVPSEEYREWEEGFIESFRQFWEKVRNLL